MVLLDIDRIPELMAVSPFTSMNRWNWASFHDADHFGDPAEPMRQRLARDAASHGAELPDGPIFLLTHLRYLGYCFNPVSFFYCHDAAGKLRLVLAEVHNTFGGAKNYWLTPQPSEPHGRSGVDEGVPAFFRASAAKRLYVSPFMPPALDYRFALTAPVDRLVAHISLSTRDAEPGSRHRFDATLQLAHRPWTHREIAKALLRHPVMTARVTAAIHWQALRLWWKGMPLVPRPSGDGALEDSAAPAGRVTV
jgi:hypothetical protein